MSNTPTPVEPVAPRLASPAALTVVHPEAPTTTPDPWVPYALEKSMGATCDTIEQYEKDHADQSSRGDFFPAGACKGLIPLHLKRLLMALPEVRGETLEQRKKSLDAPAFYLAVPGFGARPDFMAAAGSWVIRTFEGPDPEVTVFATWDPDCRLYPDYSFCTPRFFRVVGDTFAQVVGGDVWPGAPVITPPQWKYMYEHGAGNAFMRFDKLAYAPTFRWVVEYDPANMPPPHAPLPKGWARGHLGFVVWNGTRFEYRTTVPRKLWPCAPVWKGETPCSNTSWDEPADYVTR